MNRIYKAIVIGASAGGFEIIPQVIKDLPENYPIPVVVVLHMKEGGEFFVKYLNSKCKMKVREAEFEMDGGFIYTAPPGFHLYIGREKTFSISVDDKVNYSRPAIDVLFESASKSFRETLIGVVLTGTGCDGTLGMISIKERGGLTIVQDPKVAESPEMPLNALKTGIIDFTLSPREIFNFLFKIVS